MVYTMLTETPPSFYNMPQPVGGVLSRPYIPPFTVCQRVRVICWFTLNLLSCIPEITLFLTSSSL